MGSWEGTEKCRGRKVRRGRGGGFERLRKPGVGRTFWEFALLIASLFLGVFFGVIEVLQLRVVMRFELVGLRSRRGARLFCRFCSEHLVDVLCLWGLDFPAPLDFLRL